MKVKVKNEGKSAAFFKLSVKNQNQIYQFVLTKGQERRLKVTLNDKNSNVAMFYGPEITRKICKTLPHLEYTSKENSFLLGEDFRCYFEGEKPLPQGGNLEFDKHDLKTFFEHLRRQLINITVVSDPTFLPLPYSEVDETTLTESRIEKNTDLDMTKSKSDRKTDQFTATPSMNEINTVQTSTAKTKIDKKADQSADTHCRVDKNSSEIPIKKSKFDRKPDGSVNLQSKVHGTYMSSFFFVLQVTFSKKETRITTKTNQKI